MKIEQNLWKQKWQEPPTFDLGDTAQLVLLFGSPSCLSTDSIMKEIREAYPKAEHIGCSTAGEVCGDQVLDDSIVVTAIQFESTTIQIVKTDIDSLDDSEKAGTELANQLSKEGLRHVFVLSDGLNVNGSSLVDGLTGHLPERVSVTGGLSGDGPNFKHTLVVHNDSISDHQIVAVGFFGEALNIGYGSLGGWDPFGPERLVTKSKGNVLYELDGKSALEVYKQYLGEHAEGLPGTGLLFPLSIRLDDDTQEGIVRTILGVDEEAQSLTFAGSIPEGAYARLMKANFDRLIDGAIGAANTCHQSLPQSQPDLAILISCVGRKMVLKQRIEEEVEGVREVLGVKPVFTGFYSYGEISPFTPNAKCELHNQTMTITTFTEMA